MAIVEEQESWAASRMRGLGGSDLPAILGLSQWRKPIDVWESKVHPERVPELDKECLWFGSALEPIIRERYAMKFGVEVVAPADIATYFPNSRAWNGQTVVTGREPWMLGTADGWMPTVNCGLEVKNVGRKNKEEWGEFGSDAIPAMYVAQVHWYCDIYGAKAWNIAPLFSGNTLGQYQVKFDAQLAKEMYDAARDFWHSYVVKQVEPPIDESESYGKYLARKFSLSTGAVIKSPSPELIDAASNLYHSQRAVKAAEEEAQLRKNQIASLLADADAAITPFGKVAWVRPVPRQTIDWDGVAAECGIAQSVIDAHIIERPVGGYVRGYWKK